MHDQNNVVKAYKDILSTEDPDDRAYSQIVLRIANYTMTMTEGLDATYALFQAIKYLTQNAIAGDLVECGVWKGGSMMLAAHALKHFGDTSRHLWLYDTFSGMPEPEAVDIDFDGNSMQAAWSQAARGGNVMGFGGSADVVRYNLESTRYPAQNMHFIVGDVLETIPAQAPRQIALLRLDTDWYRSTLHELQHFYDRLVSRGVLLIDDYGWCRGARQAVDEFFGQMTFRPMMHRVNQGTRILIKP